jgi:hypothetical protein
MRRHLLNISTWGVLMSRVVGPAGEVSDFYRWWGHPGPSGQDRAPTALRNGPRPPGKDAEEFGSETFCLQSRDGAEFRWRNGPTDAAEGGPRIKPQGAICSVEW